MIGGSEIPVIVQAVDACREALGGAELSFIRGFQRTLDLDMDGATLRLFHGSPRSHMEDLLATTPGAALDEALGEHRPTVLAGGHTHIQMLRQHRGTLLVNPGSVGLPFERFASGGPPKVMSRDEYAIVYSSGGGTSLTLNRVPVDRGALIAAVELWDNPLRYWLLQQYRS